MRHLVLTIGLLLFIHGIPISTAYGMQSQSNISCAYVSFDAMTFLTAILAFCAVVSLVVSGMALKLSQKNVKKAFRPVINVTVEWRENLFWLVVRNLGKTAAGNIQMKISPTPKIKFGMIDEPIPFVIRPLPLLQPGEHYECAFANENSLIKMSAEMRFKGKVYFEDMSGEKLTDKIDIDARIVFESMTPCKKTTSDIVNSLNSIKEAIQSNGLK